MYYFYYYSEIILYRMVYERHITPLFPSSPSTNFNQTFPLASLLLDLGLLFYTFLYISKITYKNTVSFISAIYVHDQRSSLHCNIDEFSHTVDEFIRNLMTNMSLGNQIYDSLWQKIRKKWDTLCFLYLYISFVTVFLLNKQEFLFTLSHLLSHRQFPLLVIFENF